MSEQMYCRLSGMMFLEFAIWGAWAPVLAAWLLGPLKMNAKQTAWIYATLPLACIISPMLAGQIVDRWFPTEWFLAGAHLATAVALFVASRRTTFRGMFLAMGVMCLLYVPTMALVNSLTFAHIVHRDTEYFVIRVWGSVSWVLVGWTLALWRWSGRFQIRGCDALVLAAVSALAMGLYSLTLPHTPPKGASDTVFPAFKALEMCKDPKYLIFLFISFLVGTQLQFYYVGTSRFLEDIGVQRKSIPAAMTVAQVVQAICMWKVIPYILPKIGYGPTLALGILAWAIMYLFYAGMRPRWLVVCSMMFHGFAFAGFYDTAYIYVETMAKDGGFSGISASAQALYLVVYGLGQFAGTRFSGVVMDKLRTESGFRWRPIFITPCILLALAALGCFLAL